MTCLTPFSPLHTGQPSNSRAHGDGSGGGSAGNTTYASETYRVPSGAIVDWGGNVIVPAPAPSGQ
jgi:hypothetical protein